MIEQGEYMGESVVNTKLRKQADVAIDRLQRQCLRRGFFGRYTITVEVCDGTVREVVEQVERKRR